MGFEMKRSEQSPIELFEEAIYLLRRAPVAAIATYYVGSLPFVLAFLFFWADMSQSSFAYDHCAPGSLVLAFLYGWMVVWQALFARRLRAEHSGAPPSADIWKELRPLGFVQLVVQPTKLLLLPLAALVTLPFGRAYAFYQSLMAVPQRDCEDLSHAIQAARKQSRMWQQQNWTAIAMLAILNLVVFVNIGATILLVPYLLKMLLGVETVFTRSGTATLNTTFAVVTAGLTYLAANPLAKAVYVLRYFYSESIETGEDLRAELKVAQTFLSVLFLIVIATPARAQQPTPNSAPTPVSVTELNQAIDNVIHRAEFTWRLPRQPPPPANRSNWFVRSAEWLVESMTSFIRQLGQWFEEFIKWLEEQLRKAIPGSGTQPGVNSNKLRALIYALLAGVTMVLGWLLWRAVRHRRRVVPRPAIASAIPVVSLDAEELQADQHPLDEWLQIARDCMSRQEWRLALRALYLAGLANLADRSLIAIHRGKSNQDYARELRRKARAKPELIALFSQNIGTFERVWYGMYDVDLNIVEQFEANLVQLGARAAEQ
jgi:hypothetical protein